MSSHFWQNVALVTILLVATYFSVAAMVAVPELTALSNGSATADVAELKTLLQAPERQFTTPSADFLKEDPYQALVMSSLVFPDAVYFALDSQQTDRNQIRTELQNSFDWWRNQVSLARSQAFSEFQQNAQRKGDFERAQHYAALLQWFDTMLSEAEREVYECAREFQTTDASAKAWSERTAKVSSAALTPGMDWSKARKECQDRWPKFPPVPQRRELGAKLGPFGVFATWLLKTESLSLVTIVGLFGFGLLGAATSTIIRERGMASATAQPLVTDLASVIVRGMSAAIVVFLAVKGGLTVLAAGASEPNAYVLMLLCLVAAVYSEPVWEGARAYLGGLTSRWASSQGGDGNTPSPKP